MIGKAAWVLMLVGAVLMVAALAQPMVDAIELIGGVITAGCGGLIELCYIDADLPEAVELLGSSRAAHARPQLVDREREGW